MSYATTNDLQARWRTLNAGEMAKAGLVLADVERDIRREFPGTDARMLTDPTFVLDVRRITCAVTRRRLVNEDAENLDQISENDGIYGRRQPTLDDGLTPAEQRILSPDTTDDVSAGYGLPQWSNEP